MKNKLLKAPTGTGGIFKEKKNKFLVVINRKIFK